MASRILPPPGNDRLTLSGEVDLAVLSPAIDPLANGFSIGLFDSAGSLIFARTIPGGARPTYFLPGWSVDRTGSVWTYRDADGLLAPGVTKVVVRWRFRYGPGRYSFTLFASRSDFAVTPSQGPFSLHVVLGGAEQAATGQCGWVDFHPPSTLAPMCLFRSSNDILICR